MKKTTSNKKKGTNSKSRVVRPTYQGQLVNLYTEFVQESKQDSEILHEGALILGNKKGGKLSDRAVSLVDYISEKVVSAEESIALKKMLDLHYDRIVSRRPQLKGIDVLDPEQLRKAYMTPRSQLTTSLDNWLGNWGLWTQVALSEEHQILEQAGTYASKADISKSERAKLRSNIKLDERIRDQYDKKYASIRELHDSLVQKEASSLERKIKRAGSAAQIVKSIQRGLTTDYSGVKEKATESYDAGLTQFRQKLIERLKKRMPLLLSAESESTLAEKAKRTKETVKTVTPSQSAPIYEGDLSHTLITPEYDTSSPTSEIDSPEVKTSSQEKVGKSRVPHTRSMKRSYTVINKAARENNFAPHVKDHRYPEYYLGGTQREGNLPGTLTLPHTIVWGPTNASTYKPKPAPYVGPVQPILPVQPITPTPVQPKEKKKRNWKWLWLLPLIGVLGGSALLLKKCGGCKGPIAPIPYSETNTVERITESYSPIPAGPLGTVAIETNRPDFSLGIPLPPRYPTQDSAVDYVNSVQGNPRIAGSTDLAPFPTNIQTGVKYPLYDDQNPPARNPDALRLRVITQHPKNPYASQNSKLNLIGYDREELAETPRAFVTTPNKGTNTQVYIYKGTWNVGDNQRSKLPL